MTLVLVFCGNSSPGAPHSSKQQQPTLAGICLFYLLLYVSFLVVLVLVTYCFLTCASTICFRKRPFI